MQDPYLLPTYSKKNKFARAAWELTWILFFRPSPKLAYRWRALLLKIFGAKIGKNCAIHQSVKIWAPWNLICEDTVAIGNGVEIYNPKIVSIGSHAILSQGSYICGASHDPHLKNFPTVAKRISIESYAWICARSCVMPGVIVSEGAVLALGSIATKNLDSWTIYAGSPAKKISNRRRGQ